MRVKAKWLVNCAGLGAQDLARSIVGLPACAIPPLHLAKGSYFALRGRAPCQRLVYPMPEPGGLGIHLTLDLAGSARFGPDVEWVERVDYTVNSDRMEKFEQSIRRYWPGLPDGALAPAHCGIRPKLSVPGEPNADFSILGPADLGVPGQLHLFGIESPGLTSALAIAQHVSAIVARHP
jgi:L-2-hydroxyglutarate oxidase LhgO